MGKVKYNEEMKLQTVKYVLEGGKSATKVAKELGIDTNTVCRWVREYREAQGMPSYEAEQRIKRQTREKRKNREIWLVEAIRRIFIENREVRW